jgi:nucleotide-binding universal stress UspA family protein
MYQNILIPTDGSELASKAITHGVELAKVHNAKITGVAVSPTWHDTADDEFVVEISCESYKRSTAQRASKWLAPIAEAAKAAGVPCETVHATDNHPWQGIIATAKNRGCDLIVMASHGRRGLSALVIGSETVKVLTHSTIPVLVYR